MAIGCWLDSFPFFTLILNFASQIILSSFVILKTHGQKDIHPYESVENACDKCACSHKEDNQPEKFYVLNCISKNFSQILADYPPEFDLSDKGDTKISIRKI